MSQIGQRFKRIDGNFDIQEGLAFGQWNVAPKGALYLSLLSFSLLGYLSTNGCQKAVHFGMKLPHDRNNHIQYMKNP